MKLRIFLLMSAALLVLNAVDAQTVNWSSFKPEQKHIANVNAGFDNSFSFGVAYGYRFNIKFPLILNVEHSQPAGEKLLDDFKTKIGGQIRLLQLGDFHFTAKVQGIFRRYENPDVRMVNFGSDMSAIIGYYRPIWFAAGEFGFDKAISTNFKHGASYREIFPDIKNGWYQPATAGNVYFGLQAGVSINKFDITLKGGRTIQQDFKTTATVPFYGQIAFGRRF